MFPGNCFFSEKYEPVKDISIGGVVLLDNVSGEKEEIVAPMVVDKVGLIIF